MINFFLIGSSGYIAKKHIECIYKLKGNLKIACDVKTDGYLDRYFPDTQFIESSSSFFSKIKTLNGEKKLVICTPNYLHFKHIILGLKAGCDVLCEKPPVLRVEDLNKIRQAEKKYKKKCFFVLQLRHDENILKLKKNISKKNIKKINVNYITHRGEWYSKSWKGIKKKSGGIVYNIGIHLFDILYFLFGEFDKITKISVKSDYVNLKIFIQKIQIQIVLSTNKKYIPKNVLNKKVYQFRKIKIDKKNLEFSKNFNNLHIKIYNKFIKNKGWNSDQILYVIKTLNKYFKV
jgi:UDP-N-acetyl-2-amino-2-deoxyglucuronate dehydrogenase